MNIAYLNGRRCEDLHVVSLYNPSFLYGINCFEGIRAYWNSERQALIVLDIQPHLDRLSASAAQLGLSVPIEVADLEEHIRAILQEHLVREDSYIRITVFLGGDGSWRSSNDVHYLVSVRSMPSTLASNNPVALGISEYRRISSTSMPPSVKAGANYLNSRYAYLDASARGFDDALLLTEGGYVSEATGSAIIFIKGDQLFTPSFDCDILRSVTRAGVLERATQAGRLVHEERISARRLPDFDSALIVGTSAEIRAVNRIEGFHYAVESALLTEVVADFIRTTREVPTCD